MGRCSINGSVVSCTRPSCDYAKKNFSYRFDVVTLRHPSKCGSCPKFLKEKTYIRMRRKGSIGFGQFLSINESTEDQIMICDCNK